MSDKVKLERQAMCDRLAMEFQDGWIVNLGWGCPPYVPTIQTPAEKSSTMLRTVWSVMDLLLKKVRKTVIW